MSLALAIASRRRRPKPVRRFPPEVLAPVEVRALLDACDTRTIPGLRNRALLAFVYRTGLRTREALEFWSKDLDFSRGGPDGAACAGGGGAIRVLFAKGGRSRTVGIESGGAAEVAAWLAVRERVASGAVPAWRPSATVFCSVHGNRLTESYVRRLLPHLARRTGIAKRVHAHGLRHTHAAELQAEGFDIGIISKQLGHASIATTARYLDHIAPWALVDAVGGGRGEVELKFDPHLPDRNGFKARFLARRCGFTGFLSDDQPRGRMNRALSWSAKRRARALRATRHSIGRGLRTGAAQRGRSQPPRRADAGELGTRSGPQPKNTN